jgi:hypothetical protein
MNKPKLEIPMTGKKTLIAAAIALCTLGAASAAQAHDDGKWYPQDDDPGPPVPGIHTMPSSHGAPYWHTSGANAYGFVPPANHAHHNSKERIRGR